MGTTQSVGTAARTASCTAESDVARATQSLPLQLAQTASGCMAAARWRNPPVNIQLDPPDRHLLIFHQRGSTAIEARIGNHLKGHGSRIGSVTMVPAGTPSHWHLHGQCDVIHVYLQASRLRGPSGHVHELAPAFARQDRWLAHWFGMLSTEMAVHHNNGQALPALLADEFEGLLVRHLTCDTPSSVKPRGGLPGGALRRIDEYLNARLSDDLRVSDLSAAACLSDSHFIRAFRQSVGCTPWQYVLNRRLEVAENLLLQGMAAVDAARHVGLGTGARLSRLYRQQRGMALASSVFTSGRP